MDWSLFLSLLITIVITSWTILHRRFSCDRTSRFSAELCIIKQASRWMTLTLILTRMDSFSFTNATSLLTLIFCSSAMYRLQLSFNRSRSIVSHLAQTRTREGWVICVFWKIGVGYLRQYETCLSASGLRRSISSDSVSTSSCRRFALSFNLLFIERNAVV